VSLSEPPSETVVLASGAIEATVLPELGARLHSLRVFDRELLRSPADIGRHSADPFFWGGFVLAPWSNRLAAEPTIVDGRLVELGANFRDGTAIHGQVYLRPWERSSDNEFVVLGGGDAWPWPYEVRQSVLAGHRSLTLELALRNLADERMPAGIGLHPWFRRPLEMAIHAELVYRDNLAATPVPEPVSGAYDLRQLGPMGDDLDATWSDVAERAVRLAWPQEKIAATLSCRTSGSLHVVAASPAGVEAVAVEPATNAPQALRRLLSGQPGGLIWLASGEVLRLTSVIEFQRVDSHGG
jgi:aldose 1-epimerase